MGADLGVGSSTEKQQGQVAASILQIALNWIISSLMKSSTGFGYIKINLKGGKWPDLF